MQFFILQIYAGSNQWLEKEAWGTCFGPQPILYFVTWQRLVYWTPDQLRSCSVTGTLSNKSRAKGVTEPRPASTPEKVASLKGLQHIAYRSYTATCSVLFQFEITSASVNVASGVADYCAVHLFRFSNLVMFINYRNSVC